ncbi:MAG: hypothetical protein H7289_16430 [Mucilaginibacter sp.]|nr:hypothetical protein [Mucilaginibacter sp.]
MKKLLTFLCCIITVCVNAQVTPGVQQKINKFHIIDSATKKPVITSVTIARANLTITTEKDGVFIIPGDLTKMRDTINFNTQGYQPVKLSLSNLSVMDTIKLKKYTVQKIFSNLSYKDDTLLNDFNRRDVGYYAGICTVLAKFEYHQLAQKFTTQKAGVRLKTARIIRLIYNNADVEQPTKYHLRVYDTDAKTGGPSRDLCNEVIEVSSSDGQQNNVNLKKYNIVIPGKTFFVAIEWMQDYYNSANSAYFDTKTKKKVIVPGYKPAIGISPITGKDINIWALSFKNEWKPYTYFAPFGTDLAIRVSIEY